MLKAEGSFGCYPQDDSKKTGQNKTSFWGRSPKNPIHSSNSCTMLKAMGSFGCYPQDDSKKNRTKKLSFWGRSPRLTGGQGRIPRNAIDGQLLLKAKRSFASAQDDAEKKDDKTKRHSERSEESHPQQRLLIIAKSRGILRTKVLRMTIKRVLFWAFYFLSFWGPTKWGVPIRIL